MQVQYCQYDDDSIIRALQHFKTLNYKIVDIGGSMSSWSQPYTDMVIDINAQDTERSIQIDLCDEPQWQKAIEYVKINGKFNFAICTHTLEDLYNPFVALKYLPQISDAGVISMPSIQIELSKIEGPWIGYVHHRWIFDFDGESIVIIPKLSILDSLMQDRKVTIISQEIRFFWEGSINYKVFMNNFLGPDVKTVIKCYTSLIERGTIA